MRLSHQMVWIVPRVAADGLSAEMSGKTWCPVVSLSISDGPTFAPVAPLTRRKKMAAWPAVPDSIVPYVVPVLVTVPGFVAS